MAHLLESVIWNTLNVSFKYLDNGLNENGLISLEKLEMTQNKLHYTIKLKILYVLSNTSSWVSDVNTVNCGKHLADPL